MNRTFANNLLAQREALGLSAADFALSIRVSPDEYAAWERGESLPPLEVAERIAQKCGVTVDELMHAGAAYQPKLNFGSEDGISESEKQREWAAYEEAADRRYVRGRRIMKAILITEIAALVLSLFTQSILASVLQIVVLVFLWRGKKWARYIFAGLCLFSGVVNLIVLARLDHPVVIAIAILITTYQLAAGALICWNPAVEEFLSEQDSIY